MNPNTFVFDTNALISAFLIRGSVSDLALAKATEVGILAVSNPLLQEFAEVLWRKKFDRYFKDELERMEILSKIEEYAVPFITTERIAVSSDPDDNMVLELAIACAASCVVSGDPHLRSLSPFRGIPIVSASEFIDMF